MLEIRGLTKRFGGLAAVSEVDLSVPKGRIMSLIGPNGAGKTTVFNMITGFLTPTSGTISLDGRDITGAKPADIAKLGVVRTFQKTNVMGGLTVFENVLTAHYLSARVSLLRTFLRGGEVARREGEIAQRTTEILEFLGLQARADVKGNALSYGELRLLAIAVALAAGPRILLLDEPAAGLNLREADNLVEILQRLNQERGLTVLLVEHNMSVVMRVSERVAVLRFGRKLAEGLPAEIQSHPDVVEAYLGKGAA